MAITSIDSFSYPNIPITSSNAGSTVIDASGEKLAFIFQVPAAMTITGAAFRVAVVTTSGSFDVRLETVSASDGNPTGTLASTNSNASLSISTTGIKEATFTASHTAAAGDILALVIVAGSPGNIGIGTAFPGFTGNYQFPYADHFTASWTKTGSGIGCFAIKTTSYVNIPHSHLSSIVAINCNTGTTPDEIGNRINFPFSCEISGVVFIHTPNATTRTYDIVLYNSSGIALATITPDLDIGVNATQIRGNSYVFSSPQTLSASTDYYLVFKPTTANSITLYYHDFEVSDLKNSAEFGSFLTYASRTDAGSWSDTSTRIAMIFPVITGYDFGGAGGGLITHPSMTGGMRG